MTVTGVRSCHDSQAPENKAAEGSGAASYATPDPTPDPNPDPNPDPTSATIRAQTRDHCVDAGVGGRRPFVAGGG